jgi:hypothetical protein
MGEKVARSIVGRLSPKPQILSNLGVARLCPRGMLLGGEWTTQADVEIGLKENECVSSWQGSRALLYHGYLRWVQPWLCRRRCVSLEPIDDKLIRLVMGLAFTSARELRPSRKPSSEKCWC